MTYIALNRNNEMIDAVNAEDWSQNVFSMVRKLEGDDYIGNAFEFFEFKQLLYLFKKVEPGDTLTYHLVCE